MIVNFLENMPVRFSEYYTSKYNVTKDEFNNEIYESIERLKSTWHFEEYKINPKSHFGLVLHVKSKKYGKLIIKVIPIYADRFIYESNAYRELCYPSICDIYSIDENSGAIILKEIPNEINLVKGYAALERIEKVNILFEEILMYKKIASKNDIPKFLDYNANFLNVIEKSLSIYIDSKTDWTELKKYTLIARRILISEFTCSEKFVLHGDIHHANILCERNKLVIIDPIGSVGDIIFEFTRFIGSELIITHEEDIEESLTMMMDKIKHLNLDSSRLYKGVFIDSVLRACNTFWEGTAPFHTKEWITVLRTIYHILKENKLLL